MPCQHLHCSCQVFSAHFFLYHLYRQTMLLPTWLSDLDLWPMTLTSDLDLDILTPDLHAEIQACMFVRLARIVRRTDTQTYGLRRLVTHTDVCSLCATHNGMRAPFAPSIFHTYEKYLWKNIVSLVHRGAYCAGVVHIAPSWCTSSPNTGVVVYNVPWVHPDRQTDGCYQVHYLPRFMVNKYRLNSMQARFHNQNRASLIWWRDQGYLHYLRGLSLTPMLFRPIPEGGLLRFV